MLKLNLYRKSTGTNLPRLPIQTTRGCPFNCNFCSVTNFWGPKIRTKPLENVEKELLHIRDMGTNRVFITDDNFIAQVSYTRELIKLIKKYNFTFFCQISSNVQKHEDIIRAMGEAGCVGVFIGVESFSDNNLFDMNKKFNEQVDYKKLFALFEKANIQVTAGIMMGMDGDTRETMQDTIHRLCELNVSHMQLNLLMLLPGTKLKERYEKENRITDLPVLDAPVHTAWDLGVGDSTAIWFWQNDGLYHNLIDYYENSGEGLAHYVGILNAKPYEYGNHFAPHDASHRGAFTAETVADRARTELGLKFQILPKDAHIDDGIEAVRGIFPRCRFDKTRCQDGLHALMNYQKVQNEKHSIENRPSFSDRPLHNWASHGADAFRYFGRAAKQDDLTERPVLLKIDRYSQQDNAWML